MKSFVILILLSYLLTGCATPTEHEIDPTNLSDLESVNDTGEQKPFMSHTEMSQLRTKALQDTAMGLGAQGGLAFASQQINARLEKDRWNLEAIYNFNGMMLSHGVLPPVLVEGNNSLNLADPNTIRIADKTYLIVSQARFATTPPNWREYLWMSYSKPEAPYKFLMPRTKEEQEVWKKAVDVGWEKGLQQAYSIFQQSLARLKRDYNGMILYRKLLQEKMVSPPYVSRTELGVTGNGNDMRINDQVLRITELPRLQTNSDNWKAIVVKENDND
jgi:defect-in-organelle-trafficking protein DotC